MTPVLHVTVGDIVGIAFWLVVLLLVLLVLGWVAIDDWWVKRKRRRSAARWAGGEGEGQADE